MKTLLLTCSLLACSTLLPDSTAASPDAGASAAASLQASPIKMRGAGTVLGDPTVPGGANFQASGVSNHLGNWTNEGVLAIDLATNDATGAVVFTAANGDQLFGVFDGTFDPTTGTANATFVWTGGTGRFVAASGTADFVVRQDPTGPFSFEASGTLDV